MALLSDEESAQVLAEVYRLRLEVEKLRKDCGAQMRDRGRLIDALLRVERECGGLDVGNPLGRLSSAHDIVKEVLEVKVSGRSTGPSAQESGSQEADAPQVLHSCYKMEGADAPGILVECPGCGKRLEVK